jgi:hypothetical protein
MGAKPSTFHETPGVRGAMRLATICRHLADGDSVTVNGTVMRLGEDGRLGVVMNDSCILPIEYDITVLIQTLAKMDDSEWLSVAPMILN